MKLYKLLFLCAFSCVSFFSYGQSSADLKRKKEAIQRDIDKLRSSLNAAEKNKKITLTQVNALKTQIRLRQQKIETVNAEIRNLDNQIHDNTNKVRNLQGQLGTLKKEYASMIRFAQRNRNAYDKMMFIFAAHNFNQAYKRIKYLQQFGQYRKKQAGYIEGKKKDLGVQINVLDKSLKEKSNLLHDEEAERNKLQKNRDQQSVVLNKYTKQSKQFQLDLQRNRNMQNTIDRQMRSALAREAAELRRKAEAAEAAAAAKARAEGKPVAAPSAKSATTASILTRSPEAMKLNAAFESNKGNLPWPVESKLVTENFGRHKLDAASYYNEGINIQTNPGASVRAVFEGTVQQIFPIQGKFSVIILHGQYFTVYSNLKSVSVSVDSKVSTRQAIGTASSGDMSEFSFQIHKIVNNTTVPQNPESWLAR